MAPIHPIRRFSERPLRLPRLRPYVPRADDPAIFWFNSERGEIITEVTNRVVERHGGARTQLEYVLNDAARAEIQRLERQRDAEAEERLGRWKGLARRIGRLSDTDKREELRAIARRMAEDVAGNFDPRVYKLSTVAVPKLLTGVMRPSQLPMDLLDARRSYVDDLLSIEGHSELLGRLARRGTLVFVPTHSSNLDSIVLGYALERIGLPPVVYGAGKNLFSNPIISFFMHNLGAYRVDRRIKASLYKDVLKSYSGVMIERGYHSLFFPGGTRSRSGMIERHLKLGLAGSGVEAFARNQVRGIDRPVWFVPVTINYALCLEAETLVQDWLSEEGQARYIIEDDEFSRIDRWVAFFRKLVGLSSACVLRFGRPLDPFGNEVDDDGHSLKPSGGTVDPRTYVYRRGKPTLDPSRDAAYTKDLGDMLAHRYRSETVIMSTQLVAHVLFRRLVKSTPGLDLFGRIRVRGEVGVTRDDLRAAIGTTRDRLLALERAGVVRVSPTVRSELPDGILARALDAWHGYHSRTAVLDRGSEILVEDPILLLYYQNRLVPFAVDIAPEDELAAAREIAAMGVHA